MEQPEAGPSSGGRRPAALRFNERVGVVLAADLGAEHGRLAIYDLAGVVLAEGNAPLRIADGPDVVLDWVEGGASTSCWRSRARAGDVLATAIGVPGPVEDGRPAKPPIMPGWDDYPVAERLSERFGAPALVERDVNAMALGSTGTTGRRSRTSCS